MITLSFLVLFAASAHAQSVPAECIGKSGPALTLCVQQSQIKALQAEVAELRQVCEDACDGNAAPAAPAPRAPSGPVKTPRLDAAEAAIEELERKLEAGAISPEELERELGLIRGEIATIKGTLEDHERRIRALEDRPAVPPPPPPAVEPIPGRDGQPAEITLLLAAADGFHSTEVNIVGSKVEFRVGGRPTSAIHLGGYGSGFIAPGDDSLGNDLGYGVGGYLGVDALPWLRPMVTLGWREVGLDITPQGSRRSFQGVEIKGALEFRPVGKLVLDAGAGAWFTGDGTAFTWQLGAGARF